MDKDSLQPQDSDFESLLKVRLQELQELFQGAQWALFQVELRSLRLRVLEHAAATESSDRANYWLNVAKAFSMLVDGDLETYSMQAAGQQPIDKPGEVQHYMALDSADLRQLKAKGNLSNAH